MKHVKGFITRKTMLYETGVEYGDYTMNHVLGCAHGCKYPCYAFQQKKRFGNVKSYEEWLQPYLVSNTLELLDKEIPKLKDKIKSVQLCFTTDPFMYGYDEIRNMSIAAIRKLNEAGIICTTLTKGILPIELKECSLRNEHPDHQGRHRSRVLRHLLGHHQRGGAAFAAAGGEPVHCPKPVGHQLRAGGQGRFPLHDAAHLFHHNADPVAGSALVASAPDGAILV